MTRMNLSPRHDPIVPNLALRISRVISLPSQVRSSGEEARRGTSGRPERGTVSIGRHNRHRREPPESRAVSSAGRMVSSLFRSEKSGNRAYILVEKVRDPTVPRQETDGTPLPSKNCIFPSVPPLIGRVLGFRSRRERRIASVGCIGRVRVVPRGPLGLVASPNPRVPGPDLTQKKRVSPRRRTRHRAPDYSREILTFRALRLRLRARRPPAMS